MQLQFVLTNWEKPLDYSGCSKSKECVSLPSCPKLSAIIKDGLHVRNLTVRRTLNDATCHVGGLGKEEMYVCCDKNTSHVDNESDRVESDETDAPKMIEPRLARSCGQTMSGALGQRCTGCDDAYPGEFPWMVRLLYADQAASDTLTMCGGSLVSSQHVITAAHCLNNITRVVLGETDIT